jgi:pyridoxamine 5'-phosphate oxidase family protein
MPFTDHERCYLGSHALGRIATASADAEPDVAPVGYRVHGDDILIGGLDNEKTIKYHNVLATQRASFVVDDLASQDPWEPRGLKIRGPADIVAGPSGKPEIRIRPQTIWSWGLNQEADTYFADTVERREF